MRMFPRGASAAKSVYGSSDSMLRYYGYFDKNRCDLKGEMRRMTGKEPHGKVIACQLFAALLAAVFLSGLLLTGKNSWVQGDEIYTKVSVVGEYRADGGPWLPLKEGETPYLSKSRLIEIKGHFSKDIEKNLSLILRMQYLAVKIRVNGREFFSFGDAASRHRLSRSGGDVWMSVLSPGLTTADLIEMELYNVYGNRYLPSAEKLLDNIYFGTEGSMYRTLFAKRGFSAVFAVFIFIFGLLELAVSVFFIAIGYRRICALLYNAGYTVFAAVWFFIQNDFSFLLPTPAFTAYMEVLSMYMVMAFFSLYVSEYMSGARRRLARLQASAAFFVITLLSLLQIAGRLEAYQTLNISTAFGLLGMLSAFAALAVEAAASGKKAPRLIVYSTLLIPAGAIGDAYVYAVTPGHYAIFVQMGSIISAAILGGVVIREYKNKIDTAARVERMENELTQSRVAIMISQIQPHFLYNALATIKALCEIDPEAAQEAIAHFSKYLRRNMDSLTSKALIPFEQELVHVENYLYIEKIRFQGKVNFVYDIKTVDFYLPTLSVQPLVENAVHYGAAAVKGGGTVSIETDETDDGYTVCVKDNGTGFDFMNVPRDDRNHVGIENVRNRIRMMCGGTLAIESEPVKGTAITIFIPKVVTDESNSR